ncbi:MAG: hypothetical protein GPJ50_13355 [Candidatus Heimdallarchaeota archaeon]|nr:hypothetical protein [Candidatus Heimdallarchaeota archaeon]
MYEQEKSLMLDRKIKALQKELNKLKRARRARRAKVHSRFPIRQYLIYG